MVEQSRNQPDAQRAPAAVTGGALRRCRWFRRRRSLYYSAVLGASDPLPFRPERILVAGVSGSGKSTLAARVARLLDVPYTELDSLHHGPSWVKRPEFEADVDAFTATQRWVTEWQYDSVRSLLADRADLLVWLDLPFRVVLPRIVRRTVVRRMRRQVLWNGNQEPPLHTVLTDPDHVVRWAVRTRHRMEERAPALAVDHPRLTVVRLRTVREVERWLREVLVPVS